MNRVYLGSYTGEGGPGLGAATADPDTGQLTVERWLGDAVPDPSWLALSTDRGTVYAVSEGEPVGAVRALNSENLKPAGDARAVGAAPAHVAVHPSGSYLLTALYGGGAVVVHPLLADGSIGAPSGEHRYGPGSHAHQVVAAGCSPPISASMP
jgi:6-phosphogluconolactonase (cycloisomerase 2 family)